MAALEPLSGADAHVFFWDLETSALHEYARPCAIMEIGIVDSISDKSFRSLVNPGIHITVHQKAQAAHGIPPNKAAAARSFPDVWADAKTWVREQCGESNAVIVMAGYKVFTFDVKVLYSECVRYGVQVPSDWLYADLFKHVTTLKPILFPGELSDMKSRKLSDVYAKVTGRALQNAHTALADAEGVKTLWSLAVSKYRRTAMLYADGKTRDGFVMQARPWNRHEYLLSQGVPPELCGDPVDRLDVQPVNWSTLSVLAHNGSVLDDEHRLGDRLGAELARRAGCGSRMLPPSNTGMALLAMGGIRVPLGGPSLLIEPIRVPLGGPSLLIEPALMARSFTTLHGLTARHRTALAAAGVNNVGDLLRRFSEPPVRGESTAFLAYLKDVLHVVRIGEQTANKLASQLLLLQEESRARAQARAPEGQAGGDAAPLPTRGIAAARPVAMVPAAVPARGGVSLPTRPVPGPARVGGAAPAPPIANAGPDVIVTMRNGRPIDLTAPVDQLKGIGPKTSKALAPRGITTIKLRTYILDDLHGSLDEYRLFMYDTLAVHCDDIYISAVHATLLAHAA